VVGVTYQVKYGVDTQLLQQKSSSLGTDHMDIMAVGGRNPWNVSWENRSIFILVACVG
jgi:hypothetical protein